MQPTVLHRNCLLQFQRIPRVFRPKGIYGLLWVHCSRPFKCVCVYLVVPPIPSWKSFLHRHLSSFLQVAIRPVLCTFFTLLANFLPLRDSIVSKGQAIYKCTGSGLLPWWAVGCDSTQLGSGRPLSLLHLGTKASMPFSAPRERVWT